MNCIYRSCENITYSISYIRYKNFYHTWFEICYTGNCFYTHGNREGFSCLCVCVLFLYSWCWTYQVSNIGNWEISCDLLLVHCVLCIVLYVLCLCTVFCVLYLYIVLVMSDVGHIKYWGVSCDVLFVFCVLWFVLMYCARDVGRIKYRGVSNIKYWVLCLCLIVNWVLCVCFVCVLCVICDLCFVGRMNIMVSNVWASLEIGNININDMYI